jgi:hypothetical protein
MNSEKEKSRLPRAAVLPFFLPFDGNREFASLSELPSV